MILEFYTGLRFLSNSGNRYESLESALFPAQCGHQAAGHFTRPRHFSWFERDGRHSRMAAAAKFLRE
jgi:hypothetical protein